MAESELVDYSLGLRLFLNPLNDLLTKSVAAQDVLMLPSHQVGSAGITFLAFYNQLKQEYAFARWNLFEGTRHQPLHPADRRLSLAFNADYALYSMSIEKMKVVDSLTLYGTLTEPFVDRLAHQIVREDLEQKALRLLRLARAASIYLSLAMDVEERRASKAETGLIMPVAVDIYPDSFKY